jgi:hypothetical protein
VEFALILPVLLLLLLGIIDFGIFYGQNLSLEAATREGARQGVLQGDVLSYTRQSRGLLEDSKLEIKFAVDTTSGTPGSLVVCARYPQSSLTGFFAWALDGTSESKSVMRMESKAIVASGSKNWTGGSCTR